RMLIDETGKMTGAVSGGCVEKEIWRQSESVFKSGIAKIIQYDGRFRLGCEGVLHILIEPFNPDTSFFDAFYRTHAERLVFNIETYFSKKVETSVLFGTIVNFSRIKSMPVLKGFKATKPSKNNNIILFKQEMKPCFKLIIIGAEHDAVQLCSFASLAGWEVTIVAPSSDTKTIENFPGVHEFINAPAGEINDTQVDSQ